MSYNSSFSSCRSLALCVSAVVTVELVELDVDSPAALLIWGRRIEIKAGGSVMGSAVEGPGCVERY